MVGRLSGGKAVVEGWLEVREKGGSRGAGGRAGAGGGMGRGGRRTERGAGDGRRWWRGGEKASAGKGLCCKARAKSWQARFCGSMESSMDAPPLDPQLVLLPWFRGFGLASACGDGTGARMLRLPWVPRSR